MEDQTSVPPLARRPIRTSPATSSCQDSSDTERSAAALKAAHGATLPLLSALHSSPASENGWALAERRKSVDRQLAEATEFRDRPQNRALTRGQRLSGSNYLLATASRAQQSTSMYSCRSFVMMLARQSFALRFQEQRQALQRVHGEGHAIAHCGKLRAENDDLRLDRHETQFISRIAIDFWIRQ